VNSVGASLAAQRTSGARPEESAAALLVAWHQAQVAPGATNTQCTNSTTTRITRSTVVVSSDRMPAV
jgi:hypothetical protein